MNRMLANCCLVSFGIAIFLTSCSLPEIRYQSDHTIPVIAPAKANPMEGMIRVGPIRGRPILRKEKDQTNFTQELRKALVESLISSQLFDQVTADPSVKCNYELSLEILQSLLDWPLSVRLFIRYSITDIKSGQLIFEDNIFSYYKYDKPARGAEAFQYTLEGAAKENVKSFIEKLSAFLAQRDPVN